MLHTTKSRKHSCRPVDVHVRDVTIPDSPFAGVVTSQIFLSACPEATKCWVCAFPMVGSENKTEEKEGSMRCEVEHGSWEIPRPLP